MRWLLIQETFNCSKSKKKTLKRYEICSKLTKKAPEKHHWRRLLTSNIFYIFFKRFYCWLWTYKSSLGWYSAYHLENFKDIIPCWNSNSSSLLKSIQSLSSGRGVPIDAWKENKLCLFPILNKFRLMYWTLSKNQ